MTTLHTPVLGILNDYDAPQARMLVVVYGRENARRWSYIGDMNAGHLGTYPLNMPQWFTPLSRFGVAAVMLPDGRLRLTQLTISAATYQDGKPRNWQGAAVEETIHVRKHLAGEVIAALQAKVSQSREPVLNKNNLQNAS